MGDAGRNPEPAGDPTRHAAALTASRLRHVSFLVALAATAAACGGSHVAKPHVAPPPKLPQALARRLAGEANAVAGALRRRDACAAKRLASRLRADTTASVGRVPAALQEPLSGGVNALLAELPRCVPPRPVTTTTVRSTPAAAPHVTRPPRHAKPKHEKKPPEHGHGHDGDHGHGHDGDHGHGHGKKDT